MSWNSWEFLWTNGSLEGSGNQMNIKSLESICIVASPFLFERDFHRMLRENLTVPCRYLSQDSAEFYHKILEQIMQWKKKLKNTQIAEKNLNWLCFSDSMIWTSHTLRCQEKEMYNWLEIHMHGSVSTINVSTSKMHIQLQS